MKNFICFFLFLFLTFTSSSQNIFPTGCFKNINVPAEYIEDIETIFVDEISYSVPIVELKPKKILIKEKAIENYYKIGLKGELEFCSRIIEAVYDTIFIPVIVRYETKIIEPSKTITKVKKIKVKDGYIAQIPCENILKN